MNVQSIYICFINDACKYIAQELLPQYTIYYDGKKINDEYVSIGLVQNH